MRSICTAAATAVLMLGELPVPHADFTMLTVPQRDRMRSAAGPASASLSADGRYLAFTSYAQLMPADADSLADIYVVDLWTGALSLESVAIEGISIHADCANPRISGDGAHLVFETAITSPGRDTPFAEVVYKERAGERTVRVSRSQTDDLSDGWSGSPAISDDGRTVVFESSATNLVPGHDANGSVPDIYLHDTVAARTQRLTMDGTAVRTSSRVGVAPTLSGDGRYIAFVSLAPRSSTPAGDADRHSGAPLAQVYLHDRRLNGTTLISATAAGTPANGSSQRPVISRDGGYIVFASHATNLVPGDDNRSADVFLFERTTGAITLVSRTAAGRTANGASGSPSISSDGRFVAFQSDASDLVCSGRCRSDGDDINLVSDVFVFDRSAGTITRVSTGPAGEWMEESAAPVLDGGGKVLAFSSRRPIDSRDLAHDFDLFVRVATPRR